MKSRPFGAQDDGTVHSVVEFVVGLFGTLIEANDPNPLLFQIVQCASDVGYAGNLHVLGGASGDLGDRRSHTHSASFRHHYSVDSCTVRSADQGAEIVRVFNAVKHYKKEVVRLLVLQDILKIGVGFAFDDGGNALVSRRFGQLGDLIARHETHGHTGAASGFDNALQSRITALAENRNILKRVATYFEGLFNGVKTVDDVHAFSVSRWDET